VYCVVIFPQGLASLRCVLLFCLAWLTAEVVAALGALVEVAAVEVALPLQELRLQVVAMYLVESGVMQALTSRCWNLRGLLWAGLQVASHVDFIAPL
jgi:hypothetical protein